MNKNFIWLWLLTITLFACSGADNEPVSQNESNTQNIALDAGSKNVFAGWQWQPLNDTGTNLYQCFDENYAYATSVPGGVFFGACGSSALLNSYTKQDPLVGTDPNSTLNNSDGLLGFKFKLINTGSDVCVHDLTTGMMWEQKNITNLSHPKYDGRRFTNYKSGFALNNANNAQKYVDDANGAAMCGYKDWRLPTVNELFGLIDFGVHYLSVPTNYYSNKQQLVDNNWIAMIGPGAVTAGGFYEYGEYWAQESDPSSPGTYAYSVNFFPYSWQSVGIVSSRYQSNLRQVRLVRDAGF